MKKKKKMEAKVETGIKKGFDKELIVWFTIGNQTFNLYPIEEETKEETLETAEFYEKMLNIALRKLKSSKSIELGIHPTNDVNDIIFKGTFLKTGRINPYPEENDIDLRYQFGPGNG